MRKIIFMLAIALLACSGCSKKDEKKTNVPSLEIVVEVDVDNIPKDEAAMVMDNTAKILCSRCKSFCTSSPNAQLLEDGRRIQLTLPGAMAVERERIYKMLTCSANIEIRETYNLGEIIENVMALEKALDNSFTEAQNTSDDADLKDLIANVDNQEPATKKSILQSKLNFASPYTCAIGYAMAQDTASVNRMLESKEAQELLPNDLKPVWSENAEDANSNLFALHATRVSSATGTSYIEGDFITKASDASDSYDQPVARLEMNNKGALLFSRMTKANVGRSIAIVLDERVLCAPVIHSCIEGGRVEIASNFTDHEVADLSNAINSGRLPARVSIVCVDIVTDAH